MITPGTPIKSFQVDKHSQSGCQDAQELWEVEAPETPYASFRAAQLLVSHPPSGVYFATTLDGPNLAVLIIAFRAWSFSSLHESAAGVVMVGAGGSGVAVKCFEAV